MLQFIIRSSLVASQLPLLKGAKYDSAEQGIVRFWKGWSGRKGDGAFERVVEMARFGATGGASPSPYEKGV